jgi:putative nucleotidyltransferase with HDIG domain
MMSDRSLDSGRVPPPVRSVLSALKSAGHRAYLVGGCVRDLARGEPVTDWDVGTSAHPEEVLRLFPGAVPTGLKHGTVTVILPTGPCEVTTFRLESGYSDARRPDHVTFTKDVNADLARRDFTVNAMAWDPIAGHEVDPFGGRADLAARLLRAVGDPAVRFREDGLRPVRAARFAATLEFEIEEKTRAALGESRGQVERVAAERIRDELIKMLGAPRPSKGLEVLRGAGLLAWILPELFACVAVPQNRYHAYDVYFHTLFATDAAPSGKPAVRLAALFHDVGKPLTRAEKENGDATFYNHQFESARLAEEAMTRLKFGRDTIQQVDYRPEWTDATVRRFVRTVGAENVADLFDLRIADNLGNGIKTGFPHYLGELSDRIAKVIAAEEALTLRDLKVDGADVMHELGLPPGPEVGRVLERLLEDVLEDPSLNVRERLIARMRTASRGLPIDTAGPPA